MEVDPSIRVTAGAVLKVTVPPVLSGSSRLEVPNLVSSTRLVMEFWDNGDESDENCPLFLQVWMTHTIHVWYIFAYIYLHDMKTMEINHSCR